MLLALLNNYELVRTIVFAGTESRYDKKLCVVSVTYLRVHLSRNVLQISSSGLQLSNNEPLGFPNLHNYT